MTIDLNAPRYGLDDIHGLLLTAPKPEPVTTPRPLYIGPERPGDAFNTRHTGADVLRSLGFELHSRDRNGDEHYTRPGKDRRHGSSATVYAEDGHTTVYSDSYVAANRALESRRPYDPFGLYAVTTHGGDYDAATRELSSKGYGAPRLDGPPQLAWAGTSTPAQPAAALTVPEGAPDALDHGWHAADIDAVLAADYDPPKPTILHRTDGAALFYPGRINALWGESGSMKSYLAMVAMAELLADDLGALYVDHEDTAAASAFRLHSIGVEMQRIAAHFAHIAPEQKWNPGAAQYLEKLIVDRRIEFVVIDSTGEAMAADGVNPNADEEVARWHQELPKFLTRRGVTVVLVDHVPKPDPKSGKSALYAIGSQRKRAAITGAAYMVEAVVQPSKGNDGQLKIVSAKDRWGTYPKGSLVADVFVTSSAREDAVRLVLAPHVKSDRPTVLMGRVSAFLASAGTSSANQIRKAVTGKNEHIDRAIAVLVDEGNVDLEMRSGRAGGAYFTLVRPFEDEPTNALAWAGNGPSNPEPRLPRPNLAPDDGATLGTEPRLPRPAPPIGGEVKGEVPAEQANTENANLAPEGDHTEERFW